MGVSLLVYLVNNKDLISGEISLDIWMSLYKLVADVVFYG